MAKKRGFITYKSYLFREKDPVIDALRTLVSDAQLSYAEVHNGSGVSITTIHSWFHGKTKRPQFATVAAVARACGARTISLQHNKPSID